LFAISVAERCLSGLLANSKIENKAKRVALFSFIIDGE